MSHYQEVIDVGQRQIEDLHVVIEDRKLKVYADDTKGDNTPAADSIQGPPSDLIKVVTIPDEVAPEKLICVMRDGMLQVRETRTRSGASGQRASKTAPVTLGDRLGALPAAESIRHRSKSDGVQPQPSSGPDRHSRWWLSAAQAGPANPTWLQHAGPCDKNYRWSTHCHRQETKHTVRFPDYTTGKGTTAILFLSWTIQWAVSISSELTRPFSSGKRVCKSGRVAQYGGSLQHHCSRDWTMPVGHSGHVVNQMSLWIFLDMVIVTSWIRNIYWMTS